MGGGNTTVIVLQKSDEARLSSLLAEQFQVCGSEEGERIKTNVLRCFQTAQQHCALTLLGAVNSQLIVGYITIQWLTELWTAFPEAFVSSFYVSLDWRNQGIGSLLLEAAVSEAKKRRAARLFLENNRKNPIYQTKFYSKKGWKERTDIVTFEFQL